MYIFIIQAFFLFFCISLSPFAEAQVVWGPINDVSPSGNGNDFPRVVMTKNGLSKVLWNNNGDVVFSRWTGNAFSTPVVLQPNGVNAAGSWWMGPELAAQGDTVYVVYKETPENVNTSNIYCLRSFNGGITFDPPVAVTNIGQDLSRFPTVAITSGGHPVIGFMRSDSVLLETRWVVSKSTDYGASFSLDTLASGWSGPTSEVCDCCPGTIATDGDNVAMIYRDNDNNIRDTWLAVSTNGGLSFNTGANIDQQNWFLTSCPATGPDAVVIGDTVYSTFMNGASGKNIIYRNKNAISSPSGLPALPVTGNFTGLIQQAYPRIASDGKAGAIVFRQIISGTSMLSVFFTNQISAGFSLNFDTITTGGVGNMDIAMNNNTIIVVWEDSQSNTVKYRMGNYAPVGIKNNQNLMQYIIYPNPAKESIRISSVTSYSEATFRLISITGQEILQTRISYQSQQIMLPALSQGVYLYEITSERTNQKGKLLVN